MKQNAKLNQVVFFNLLGPVLLNGISFFTIPIFTRLLGAENYGIYTIYASYQPLLLIVLGLQMHAVIAPASIYYTGKDRDKLLSNSLTISLAAGLIISAFILTFLKSVSGFMELSPFLVVVMIAHSLATVGVQWALAKFAYDKNAKLNFAYSITIAVSSIALSLLLIKWLLKDHPPYVGYILGHAVPYIIAGVLFFIYFLLKGRSFFWKEAWKFCLPLCLPIVFHSLSNTVLHQSAKILLQKLTQDSIAGVFGFAVTFANVINIIMNALNTTWVPFYHDDVREGKKEELKKKTNNYVFLYSCLTVGFIMAMPEVVKVFAQEEFWGSIKVIPFLTLSHYFAFLYTFPVNFEFYYKKTKSIAVGTMLASAINIVLNYFFIKWLGMFGAAIATLISYGLLYLFHSIMARVLIKEEYHYNYKFFYGYLVAVGTLTGLFYLLIDMPVIRWAIFAAAAIVLLIRTIKNKSIF